MTRQIGERVGAIICASGGKIIFAGYGTYEGDVIPDTDDIKFMGCSLKEIKVTNPKIILDNGSTIWGCECWWGTESVVKERINLLLEEGWELEEISNFNEYRNSIYGEDQHD